MKQVKLTRKVQIPDEDFVPTKEQPTVPSATNYPGAVLNLGDELAEKLIAEGSAVAHLADETAASGGHEASE